MSYLTCEACRYTFVSDKDLIQCPDCGKSQVRNATEKENKMLRCFGASYLYPVFIRIGVIQNGDKRI